jgi:urease accessory protein
MNAPDRRESAPPGEPAALGLLSTASLLRLLHLVSPALPVGAYAYSQGLEFAVQDGWVRDEASALAWLGGVAWRGLGSLDLPILLRLVRAWQANDRDAVRRWNERLMASRATSELRAEDRHLGGALVRILIGLDVADARSLADTPVGFATAFSLAAVRWDIGARETLCGYLWSWTENQVLAAMKLVPLGQSSGQRLLHRMIGDMPQIVDAALLVTDARIGAATVAQTLASALHETQYSRLFRS